MLDALDYVLLLLRWIDSPGFLSLLVLDAYVRTVFEDLIAEAVSLHYSDSEKWWFAISKHLTIAPSCKAEHSYC